MRLFETFHERLFTVLKFEKSHPVSPRETPFTPKKRIGVKSLSLVGGRLFTGVKNEV